MHLTSILTTHISEVRQNVRCVDIGSTCTLPDCPMYQPPSSLVSRVRVHDKTGETGHRMGSQTECQVC